MRYGKEQQDYPEMLRVARRIVREIIALNPAEMIRAWQTYLRLGPRDDPEIPAMRQVLKRALAK